MKKILLGFYLSIFLLSCNSNKEKTADTTTSPDGTSKTAVDLPYKASYSSSFTADVSDADLKTVLTTYKDWSDGNISGLSKAMADTIVVDMSSGEHMKATNSDLMKRWSTYRDSLSSVTIDMAAWQKMYATDKKEGYIVTWYDETDTYKNGKVDSATYHDINRVKDGKIVWYSQYKRPKK
jgi:ketosteroid isomerase-like protein